jgi:hypothetical protein
VFRKRLTNDAVNRVVSKTLTFSCGEMKAFKRVGYRA